MSTLLLLLITIVPQVSQEFSYPEIAVKRYPEAVMPGDTFYMKIVARNHHAESIYISDNFDPTTNDIQTHLRDSENQEQPLLFESPLPIDGSRMLILTEIKPGDARAIGVLSINVPPLEDIKEPFWEKHLKNLSASDAKFSLCVTMISYAKTNQRGVGDTHNSTLPFTLEIPLVMKPRPEKEMTLIQKWHESQVNEPRAFFPATQDNRKAGISGFKSEMPKNIVIKDEKVSHWYFVRIGNRYPNYPDAPETWQGWKELEENLTPSTMRDEIRLTRILIQYCDAEDDAVLKELKDWFSNMNEIQRMAMAKSLRDRAEGTYGTKLLSQFCEIYKAIREYDVVPVPESNVKHLRNLGLIE